MISVLKTDTNKAVDFVRGSSAEERPKPRVVLAILPEELWPFVMTRIEDPTDFLNFSRVSSVMQQLAELLKAEKLFEGAYPFLHNYLNHNDDFSLRLVCKNWKKAVDSNILERPKSYAISTQPVIFLSDSPTVEKFAKDIAGPLKDPFPFEIRCGLDTTSGLDGPYPLPGDVIHFWDQLEVGAKAIGHRIAALVLDIRFDPAVNPLFLVEEIISRVISGCLKQMPNLQYLLLHTRHPLLEQAISHLYSDSEAEHLLPTFSKLAHLELMTVGEGHHHFGHQYPACFLRVHRATLKTLALNVNAYQLETLEGLFPPMPTLEHLRYELNHCKCFTQHPEAHLLEHLNKAIVPGTVSLKTLAVKLDWQWRPVDIYHLFHWLSDNYGAECTLEQLTIQTYHMHELLFLRSNPDFMEHLRFHHQEYRYVVNHSNQQHFPWKWLISLPLPKVKKIQILADYQGSWAFLRPFRNCLEELTMEHSDALQVLTKGFLQKNQITKEKVRLFEYFLKLNKLYILTADPRRSFGITMVAREHLEWPEMERAIWGKESLWWGYAGRVLEFVVILCLFWCMLKY